MAMDGRGKRLVDDDAQVLYVILRGRNIWLTRWGSSMGWIGYLFQVTDPQVRVPCVRVGATFLLQLQLQLQLGLLDHGVPLINRTDIQT